MGRRQVTLVDAPVPNLVRQLPCPGPASRRRLAGRRVEVAAGPMILGTLQTLISRILGAAGRNAAP
jgi:hypothetical protein